MSIQSVGLLFVLVLFSHPALSLGLENQDQQQSIISGSEASFSEVRSDSSTSSSDLNITQAFVFSRHGASAKQFALYEGEWEPYKIKIDLGTSTETLTPLGKAQCWSMGRDLATAYPDLVNNVLEEDTFMINTIKLDKSRLCGDFIYYGLIAYTPFVGLFEDSLVNDAFQRHGNCQNCTDGTQFPFEDSQLLTENTNDDYLTKNFEIHRTDFLDLKDSCKPVDRYLNFIVDIFSTEDTDIFVENSEYFSETFHYYDAISVLQKHLYHGLPLEEGFEDLSSTLVSRAIRMKDTMTDNLLRSILNAHDSHWASQAVFTRPLIKDMLSKIKTQEETLNIYVIHDINIVGLLAFLYGAYHDIGDYIPYYASQAKVLIYYDDETNEQYVQLIYNGSVLSIRDCDELCTLEQFMALLDEYTELGGDLKEFCDPEQNE